MSVVALMTAMLLLSTGCGYFLSGTWDDDPGNWHRAFHSGKAPEVVVVHSRYERYPHWSFEAQYFFEIAPNAELKKQLFSAPNKLRRLGSEEAVEARATGLGDAPSWFAPKSLASYEVWVLAGEPERHFKLLIDKTTGHMFLNDYQV